ncbi:ATPase family associated with various cellular activities (AAA) [Oxobacter pfennigii]|uniref:ATPase family associated with various cellular activities (AAA) n=1 Tax=Oxobacter pfennigii TaxID=36849 RepID=A0A0P8YA59_9CLOT|nr:ATP-binding protein [Oxobacter pfennigii]KPU43828.1 ATPase family associated with various cellular activities (AAA) [Oxobacter pfennigii]
MDNAVSQEQNPINYGLYFESLSVYRDLFEDSTLGRLYELVSCFLTVDNGEIRSFINYYNDFYFELISQPRTSLKDYIIENILFDDNAFAKLSSKGVEIEEGLKRAVLNDLDCLLSISNLSSQALKRDAKKYLCASSFEESLIDRLPEWQAVSTIKERNEESNTKKTVNILKASEKWSDNFKDLYDFYNKNGTGMFAKYKAFVWERGIEGYYLKGIDNSDPVRLENLIDYTAERQVVIDNTLQFLKGYPANNVLLYGDRGTGKSTAVKAILNEYHTQGLRMVEVPKNNLMDFPLIIRQLKDRPQKFIVFVDDLAFEDSEESFTSLKAVLEGGLESRPKNVLIYATSNRRHLIKEKFSDRAGLHSGNRDDEVNSVDTMQEKLSLADRFGITVVFTSPNQDSYFKIVEGLASQRGIVMDKEELLKEAKKWEIWYNGRSPRTARQFVDWLEGHVGK